MVWADTAWAVVVFDGFVGRLELGRSAPPLMTAVCAQEAGAELLNQNDGGLAKVSTAADQQQPKILC